MIRTNLSTRPFYNEGAVRLGLIALAALVAAIIQVVAEVYGWHIGVTPWFAAGVCFVIRFLAIRYSWGLPVVGRE